MAFLYRFPFTDIAFSQTGRVDGMSHGKGGSMHIFTPTYAVLPYTLDRSKLTFLTFTSRSPSLLSRLFLSLEIFASS